MKKTTAGLTIYLRLTITPKRLGAPAVVPDVPELKKLLLGLKGKGRNGLEWRVVKKPRSLRSKDDGTRL